MSDETTAATAGETISTETPAETPAAAATETPIASAGKMGRSARMAGLFERLAKPEEPAGATGSAAPAEGASSASGASGTTAAEGATGAAGSTGATGSGSPQEKADAKAFAALAREKQENIRLRDEAAALHARATSEAKAAADRAAAAEAAANEARAKAEKLFSDPDAVFDHLASLGIRDLPTLQRFAAKAWSKPAEVAPTRPEDKPLTAADFTRLQEEHRKREEFSRVQRETYAAFEKHFDVPEADDAEIRFPHAALGWSREKRIAEGDRIANQLATLGRRVTLEEIAEAVEELAKQDPKAVILAKRLGKKPEAPAAAAKAATQSVKIPATQSVKAEVAPKPKETNGAAKMSHKERLAALKAGL